RNLLEGLNAKRQFLVQELSHFRALGLDRARLTTVQRELAQLSLLLAERLPGLLAARGIFALNVLDRLDLIVGQPPLFLQMCHHLGGGRAPPGSGVGCSCRDRGQERRTEDQSREPMGWSTRHVVSPLCFVVLGSPRPANYDEWALRLFARREERRAQADPASR